MGSHTDSKLCKRERRDARALQRAVDVEDSDAVARVRRVYHSRTPNPASLMHCQHVIAVELGFRSWNEMLAIRRG